ncbi:MAG: DsbA family protein [Thermoleophilia bacterium]
MLHTDPGCPWAYSAIPALRVLRWRYGDQLDWRLVVIGLAEGPGRYAAAGYTPGRMLRGHAEFRRRFGMPFSLEPKARLSGTGRACRAVVAARLAAPGAEWDALRALQLANFTTGAILDDDDDLRAALSTVPGLDAAAVVARIDDPEVERAYLRDRDEARSAAGTAASLQGKTAATDGPERFTAPSLVLERDGLRLVAGGWQTVEAYDVLIANLDPALERRAAPADPAQLLARFPEGLTTQEVTQLLVEGNDAPDRPAAEAALLGLVAEGRATATPVGDDRIWRAA